MFRIRKNDAGYGYINGNSIACASVSAMIVNYNSKYHCYEKIFDALEADSICIKKIKLHKEHKHKKRERVLLFPLSERNINSISFLEKYCNIYGFLDFRNYMFRNIEDSSGKIYSIYETLEEVNLSFYEKPGQNIFEKYHIEFKKKNLVLEYKNIFESNNNK